MLAIIKAPTVDPFFPEGFVPFFISFRCTSFHHDAPCESRPGTHALNLRSLLTAAQLTLQCLARNSKRKDPSSLQGLSSGLGSLMNPCTSNFRMGLRKGTCLGVYSNCNKYPRRSVANIQSPWSQVPLAVWFWGARDPKNMRYLDPLGIFIIGTTLILLCQPCSQMFHCKSTSY